MKHDPLFQYFTPTKRKVHHIINVCWYRTNLAYIIMMLFGEEVSAMREFAQLTKNISLAHIRIKVVKVAPKKISTSDIRSASCNRMPMNYNSDYITKNRHHPQNLDGRPWMLAVEVDVLGTTRQLTHARSFNYVRLSHHLVGPTNTFKREGNNASNSWNSFLFCKISLSNTSSASFKTQEWGKILNTEISVLLSSRKYLSLTIEKLFQTKKHSWVQKIVSRFYVSNI